jgi:hypothetical protein
VSSYKTQSVEVTFADAISYGYGTIQSLRDECQELVDNASEGLSQTQRIQTFEETASTLSDIADSEPDVPAWIAEYAFNAFESRPKNKRANASRAVRCANAVSLLCAARDCLAGVIDTLTDEDKKEWAVEMVTELEAAIDACESAEFPGMYG